MAATVQNVVETDLKTIREYRDVHDTAEHNPFIAEQERIAKEKAKNNRKDLKLENERNVHTRQTKQKEENVSKEKEAKKQFEEEIEQEIEEEEEVSFFFFNIFLLFSCLQKHLNSALEVGYWSVLTNFLHSECSP